MQYRPWLVLGTALLFQASTFGVGFFAFTLWVAPWTETFDTARGTIMLIFLVSQVVMGALAPFAGRAMDRHSIRALVIGGTLCFSLALVLVSIATAWWQIALVYGSIFVAGPLLAGPLAAQTLATRWFPRHRGTAIGISSIGTSIGGAVVPLLAAWLIEHYDWRTAHQVLAGLVMLIVVPPAWLFIRNAPEETVGHGGSGSEGESLQGVAPETEWTTGAVLRERRFWIMVMAFVPMMIVTGGIQQNFGPFAADLSLDASTTASLVSLMAIVMIFGKLFFGAMADRLDHRYLFWTSLLLIGLTLVLIHGAPGYTGLMLAVSLLGFGMGGFLPLLGAMVARTFGAASFGLVMGLIGPFSTLAAVGPVMAGSIRDAAGSYQPAWLLFLGVALVAALVMALMPATRGPETASESSLKE